MSPQRVVESLRDSARTLGFSALGVAHLRLDDDVAHLQRWLAAGHHGEMAYLARHAEQRGDPTALRPGTLSVISVRLDNFPPAADADRVLADPDRGYIARYALGRDYHRTLRQRLLKLAAALTDQVGPHGHRVFCDSAPILEKALARNAGLGWIGKNTLLLDRDRGSWSFIGELFTDAPLPVTEAAEVADGCGRCQACLRICPTDAFIGPRQLDARRCISYLTIEQHGAIPEPLRARIGNRIFGCDDCQLICPWNRHAQRSVEVDLLPRHGLDDQPLLTLWDWDETTWLSRTEGMALRRATWRGWRRNLAVALGNARPDRRVVDALASASDEDGMVQEHIQWALQRQRRQLDDAA